MRIECLYDKLIPIEKLKPHPKNRNSHPQNQIKRLADILEYQGWRYPVKVSKQSGFVTSGHGRIEAARLKGWKSIPVNFQKYDSKAQEYADVQADNSIASWSELDLSAIEMDLQKMKLDLDIDLLGIQGFQLGTGSVSNTTAELNLSGFDNFHHQCPKCGFEWDDQENQDA